VIAFSSAAGIRMSHLAVSRCRLRCAMRRASDDCAGALFVADGFERVDAAGVIHPARESLMAHNLGFLFREPASSAWSPRCRNPG